MGKNFKLKGLNWVAVLSIFAFLLGAVNTIMMKSAKEIQICTIDVWDISNKKVLELTQEMSGLNNTDNQAQAQAQGQGKNTAEAQQNAQINQQQQMLVKLNEYLKKVNARLSNPSDYGCSFIAVKGSIVQSRNVKDITEQVMRDVK